MPLKTDTLSNNQITNNSFEYQANYIQKPIEPVFENTVKNSNSTTDISLSERIDLEKQLKKAKKSDSSEFYLGCGLAGFLSTACALSKIMDKKEFLDINFRKGIYGIEHLYRKIQSPILKKFFPLAIIIPAFAIGISSFIGLGSMFRYANNSNKTDLSKINNTNEYNLSTKLN